jgi:hypothetical protein
MLTISLSIIHFIAELFNVLCPKTVYIHNHFNSICKMDSTSMRPVQRLLNIVSSQLPNAKKKKTILPVSRSRSLMRLQDLPFTLVGDASHR